MIGEGKRRGEGEGERGGERGRREGGRGRKRRVSGHSLVVLR